MGLQEEGGPLLCGGPGDPTDDAGCADGTYIYKSVAALTLGIGACCREVEVVIRFIVHSKRGGRGFDAHS